MPSKSKFIIFFHCTSRHFQNKKRLHAETQNCLPKLFFLYAAQENNFSRILFFKWRSLDRSNHQTLPSKSKIIIVFSTVLRGAFKQKADACRNYSHILTLDKIEVFLYNPSSWRNARFLLCRQEKQGLQRTFRSFLSQLPEWHSA